MAPRYTPSWKHRRRLVYAALLYCAGFVGYIILFGEDSSLLAQIAIALIGFAVTIYGVYVFGAAWDDRNVMRYAMMDAAPKPAPDPVLNPAGEE